MCKVEIYLTFIIAPSLDHFKIARYAVLQSNCCFIFLESTDLSPLYVFSLRDVTPEVEDRENPDKYSCTVDPSKNTNKTGDGLETVLLRYKRDQKIAYQFTFDTNKDKTVVKRFMDALQVNSKKGGVVEGDVVSAASVGGKKGGK